MKKLIIMIIALLPYMAMAQKEIKPNLNKAEKDLWAHNYGDAKTMIDVTVNSQEFMVAKKGGPSKDAAKAWFLRGLIYAALDTTKDARFKGLVPNPYDIAIESFNKSKEIDKGETPSFFKDPKTFLPVFNSKFTNDLSTYYFNKSTDYYNKEKNYKSAFTTMEQAMYFVPKDTTLLMYAGVYFGPSAGEYDKSIGYINEYIEKGGADTQAYLQLLDIYVNKKNDEAAALKFVKEAEKKFPKNDDFPKYELNIYLKANKFAQAREIVKSEIKKNPNEAASYYMLGQLYERTNAPDSARIAFEKSISLDPSNYDANFDLARSYYAEGRKIKAQRDKLGISAADVAARKTLIEKQRQEYKIALPYWEKLEKMKPNEEDVIFTLQDIYNTLVMDDQLARIDKKIKALGLDK